MCVGLNIFIDSIKILRKDISNIIVDEIKTFIIKSGCKNIKFEKLSSRIMGISIPDKCVINIDLLKLPIEYFIYILFHEISHQYQYNKYGENLTLDIYTNDKDIDYAVNKLMYLEKVADRLAILKKNYLFNKYGIKRNEVIPRYLNITDSSYFIKHINNIRKDVQINNLKKITDINNFIYSNVSK